MKYCDKYKISCPYYLKNCMIKCIATEEECESYRNNPIKLNEKYSTKLPIGFENWLSFYIGVINSSKVAPEEIVVIEWLDPTGESRIYDWMHISLLSLNELAAQMIGGEFFEKVNEIKELMNKIINAYCPISSRDEKQEKDKNPEG